MSQLIKVERDEKKPMMICPKCKQQIYVDLTPFQQDCTKILRDNCPKCRSEINVGVLIICNPDLRKLLQAIQVVQEALTNANKLFMGGS